MANLFDRAGMSSATTGSGTLTLGAALGAVAPNLAAFLPFAGAGVADQNIVSYLILDADGNWETGWGVYTASGTTLTRNVTKSSNSNAAITLSGNAQVFITARAEDLATVEALASANIFINGGMEVSQETVGGTVINIANNGQPYIVDCVQASYSTGGSLAISAQQVTPPGSPAFGAQLPLALQLKATTGAAMGAGDVVQIKVNLEGNRVSRLGFGSANAQAVTVGFWAYATIAGTMAVMLSNSANNRCYVANVTINSATTWEWKTVTIPGDTTGTWSRDNSIGLKLFFVFGVGTSLQGTANTWSSTFVFGTSSTTNFFATTNNVVCLTGAALLPGSHQISQEQSANLQRPFVETLKLCQRYYEKSYDYGTAVQTATTNGASIFVMQGLPTAAYLVTQQVYLKAKKRVDPLVTYFSTAAPGNAGKARDASNGADVGAGTSAVGEDSFLWNATMSAAQTTANLQVHWTADARM